MNSELASKTKAKPAKEGILSINGPVKFHFLYASDQRLDKPEQGFKEYELVLSAIRDLTVSCSSNVKTKEDESACKNRLIRIGFYGVK